MNGTQKKSRGIAARYLDAKKQIIKKIVQINRKEVTGVEVQGQFDAQRFWETLALILSRREKVKITVTVIQEEGSKQQRKEAV
jgi:hypothetical protein